MVCIQPGIPGVEFAAGSHVCSLYSGGRERIEVLRLFLLEGLSRGDRCLVGLGQQHAATVLGSLDLQAHSGRCMRSGQLELLPEGPEGESATSIPHWEVLLGALASNQYPFTRVGVEPTRSESHRGSRDGSVDLLRYESTVSALTATRSVGFLCMYDIETADGGQIIQLMKAHRHVLVGGVIVANPYSPGGEGAIMTPSCAM
jgi:hypothetical protein